MAEDRIEVIQQRLAMVEANVAAVEADVSDLKGKVDTVDKAIRANTALTENVKRDTEELVTLFKGSKLFAQLVSWGAGIAAAAATVWFSVRGR